jgi:hypothetical protein
LTYTEAPVSVTLKPHTGYDAPLLTFRADNPEEMVQRLQLAAQNDLLSAVGRVAGMYEAQFQLGKGLGGQHPNNPDGSGGGSAPAAEAPPQPAAPVDPWGGQPAQQQAPAYQQPQQAYAPPQQQAPAYQQPQQAYAPPQQQYQPAPAQAAAPAGAPMVLGMPAKYKEGQGKNGTWRAWLDPRPFQQTKHIDKSMKTDDPNHPGLAGGTHTFWAWIR